MAEIPYIDYNKLDEFYTIPALCDLFQMDKQALRAKCEPVQSSPPPQRDRRAWLRQIRRPQAP